MTADHIITNSPFIFVDMSLLIPHIAVSLSFFWAAVETHAGTLQSVRTFYHNSDGHVSQMACTNCTQLLWIVGPRGLFRQGEEFDLRVELPLLCVKRIGRYLVQMPLATFLVHVHLGGTTHAGQTQDMLEILHLTTGLRIVAEATLNWRYLFYITSKSKW